MEKSNGTRVGKNIFGESLLMTSSRTFQDLIVWQKAHQFVLCVYRFTRKFPKEEVYALNSQFRRAAISIAANIAEGYKKRGIKDKSNFFNIAQGSIEECRYYLILASDLGYGNISDLMNLLDEVARILDSYRSTILRNSG